MVRISIYGERTLSVEAITHLLHEVPEFSVEPIRASELFPFLPMQQDVFIYCANGYSNTLVNEITTLHRVAPSIRKVLIIPMIHKLFLEKLFRAGINSIISYKASTAELIQAVNYSILQQQFLCAELSKMVIKSKYPDCFDTLSQRELEITYLLANGMNIKGVSTELAISPKTVNTYRYRIFNKLAIARDVDLFKMVTEKAAYMLNGTH